jgi:hypothetical protein
MDTEVVVVLDQHEAELLQKILREHNYETLEECLLGGQLDDLITDAAGPQPINKWWPQNKEVHMS